MRRFQTDRQLAPLVAQFVPIKVSTNQPEWQAWRGRYPHEGGNAIPILYVVRADGEALYARSGAPQGEALPALLAAQLKQAGLVLGPREIQWFTEVTSELQAAIDSGDEPAAFRIMETASRRLQGAPCYASSALAFQQQAERLLAPLESGMKASRQAWADAEAQAEMQESRGEDVESAELWWPSVYGFAQLQVRFQGLTLVRPALQQGLQELKTYPAARDLWSQAETIARAQVATVPARPALARRLQRLLNDQPCSAAAALAEELLEAWGESEATLPNRPDRDEVVTRSNAMTALRQWQDATGKYQVQARFVGLEGDVVVLERADNQERIEVPWQRLSEADRAWIREHQDR